MLGRKSKPKFEGKIRLRKGDEVIVLAGKDKGRRGKIIGTSPDRGTVIVEGLNMVTRHQRPRGRTGRTPGAQLGAIQKPSPLSISKVVLVCPKCGKEAKIASTVVSDGSRGRMCKKCGELVD